MGSNTASVAVTGVDIWQGGFSHTKDQVVAEFDLREEQLVLAAGLPALAFGKERGQAGEPFLAAASQVLGRPGVGQLLEAFGCRASQKSVGALLEIEALLAHAVRQPVMLIETHPAEAFAAGYGGIAAVAMATGVAPSTIGRGLKELAQDEPSERIRRGSWWAQAVSGHRWHFSWLGAYAK